MMKKTLSLVVILSFVITGFSQNTDQEQIQTAPTTTIEFQETEFVWGEIYEGEKIQNVFTFTNTGNEPLVITKAKGSCGCTVPRWPKEPVMPGETAELLVQFDSKNKGKVSGNKQSKRVSITANTDPKVTYLTIKGIVYKEEDKTEVKNSVDTRNENFDIESSDFTLFPNPTANTLTLNLSAFKGKGGLLEIYNQLGQKIESRSLGEISKEKELVDVSQYESGTYVASLKIDGKNRIAKQFQVLK